MNDVRPALHCPGCRHDLTGVPAAGPPGAGAGAVLVCPECGASTTVYAAADETIPQRGWAYFALWAASALAMLFFAGCGLAVVVSLVWSVLAGGAGP